MFPTHGIDDENGRRDHPARVFAEETDKDDGRRRQGKENVFCPGQRTDKRQSGIDGGIDPSVKKNGDLLYIRIFRSRTKCVFYRNHTIS